MPAMSSFRAYLLAVPTCCLCTCTRLHCSPAMPACSASSLRAPAPRGLRCTVSAVPGCSTVRANDACLAYLTAVPYSACKPCLIIVHACRTCFTYVLVVPSCNVCLRYLLAVPACGACLRCLLVIHACSTRLCASLVACSACLLVIHISGRCS